jgi:muramoyltetrapeptide carboxypeptidase
MLKGKPLRIGDTIGIVAPASDVNKDSLHKGVSELERLGFRVRYSDSIFSKHYYFAGSHEDRSQELLGMFENPEIDAIFCARGGYGCHHLLRLLSPELVKSHAKIFVGYSDVTVLLQFLENLCGVACFHGPMVAREFALGEPFYDKETLLRCLTYPQAGQQFTGPRLVCLRGGTSRGILTGGCLSLLTATLGTPYEVQTDGKILFLEDVNAKLYQLDRMLMHLKLAGKLDGVRGIVFGEMLNCDQASPKDYCLKEILLNILHEYRFPVLYGLPSGHTTTGALTLPFGVQVLLNSDEKYIQLEEAAIQS